MLAFSLLAGFSALAAFWDVRFRRIPNWLSGATLLTGLALQIAGVIEGDIMSHLAHFLIALVAGMLMFRFGVWGGGDAKFYSAMAAWFSLAEAPLVLMLVALCGVALVVLYWSIGVIRKVKARLDNLPYGLAIACGAIITSAILRIY